MAYFPKKTQQDELANMNSLGPTSQAQNTVQQNQNQVAGQAPVGGASASSGSPEQAASPKSAKSSGMGADVRKYVNQNQPQNIATGVEKATDSQAQAVGQQVQKQQSQFMNQVNQQRSMQDQAYQKAQQSLQAAQNLGADGTLDDASVKQYQSAAQMQAQAPQLDLTAAQGQSQRLANTAQQAAAGRKSELLRQAFTGQGQAYTGGQSALDELILGGDTQAGERLVSQAQQTAKDQQANITQARRDALAQSGELQQQAADYRTGLTSGVDTAQDALRASLEERLGQTPKLRQAFESGQVTQDIIDQLGGNRLYGIDPLTYLKEANINSISTAEDLARARALAQLEQSQQDIITDPTAVGTQDVTGIKSLKDMVTQRQSEYESKINPVQSKLQAQEDLINQLRGLERITTPYTDIRGATGSDTQLGWNENIADYQDLINKAANTGLSRDQINTLYQSRLTGWNAGFDQNANSYLNPIRQNISGINTQYDYNNVLTPTVSAANGAVKHSKVELLKKLMEKK